MQLLRWRCCHNLSDIYGMPLNKIHVISLLYLMSDLSWTLHLQSRILGFWPEQAPEICPVQVDKTDDWQIFLIRGGLLG